MSTTAFFNPPDITKAQIIAAINASATNILIAMCSFDDPDITDAILAQFHGAYRVAGIGDAVSMDRYPQQWARLAEKNALLWAANGCITFSNKYLVIDNGTHVITGNYDWTLRAAQHSATNSIVCDDFATAQAYQTDWARWHAHATPFPHAPTLPQPSYQLLSQPSIHRHADNLSAPSTNAFFTFPNAIRPALLAAFNAAAASIKLAIYAITDNEIIAALADAVGARCKRPSRGIGADHDANRRWLEKAARRGCRRRHGHRRR